MTGAHPPTHLDALRDAMVGRRHVVVLLQRADMRQVKGECSHVAPSGAYAIVGGYHVPLDRVTNVIPPESK
jgi:hypothetical protein